MAEIDADEPKDLDGLFVKLKGWFTDDYEKTTQWRDDAKVDFGDVAGHQWTEADKQTLNDQSRLPVTMNRIDPIIDSVSGSEVSNRQEVRYLPREQGDVKVNEVLTSAAQWFRDQCDAEDEESDAFRDTLICGMGWTETRLDYETDQEGEPKIERVDPLEMVWDCTAKKRNLTDSQRVHHVRKFTLADAKAMVPGDFEDADYNANWVDGTIEEGNQNEDDGESYGENKDQPEGKTDKKVTLVRTQWWEREKIQRVLVSKPDGSQAIEVKTEAEWADLKAKYKMVGVAPPQAVAGYRRVYKQAYLGAKILEQGPAPCKEHFSFNAITGKRDRNKGTWYGLVRGMHDPQMWANKFFSQILHIINTMAKGGVVAERGAFDDDKKAEETWARQDAITWARAGSLSGANTKIQPKPVSGIPPGIANMMEFAISSIRDVSGVNVETLGQRSGDQAASLDMQRKQASMVILQPLFDSLRRYRKVQGRQMLYLIQTYLSDGRLIRIVGKEQERYAPLVKDPAQADAKFDIIVDDAPTSPNQKEATWSALQQILPAVGKMLPPATWIALLEFSPLPSSAQEKIKASIEPPKGPDGQPLPPPPDPEMEKAKMLMQIKQEESALNMQIKQQEAKIDYELKMALAQQEIEIERMRQMGKLQLEHEMGQQKMALQARQADQQMQINAFTAQQDADIRDRSAEADEARRATQPAAN